MRGVRNVGFAGYLKSRTTYVMDFNSLQSIPNNGPFDYHRGYPIRCLVY